MTKFLRKNFFNSVASVDSSNFPSLEGNRRHAMVLDTIKDGKFIFKNTHAKDQKVKIPVEKGPLEFYYLHIELKEEAIKILKKKMRK